MGENGMFDTPFTMEKRVSALCIVGSFDPFVAVFLSDPVEHQFSLGLCWGLSIVKHLPTKHTITYKYHSHAVSPYVAYTVYTF